MKATPEPVPDGAPNGTLAHSTAVERILEWCFNLTERTIFQRPGAISSGRAT